MSLTLICLVLGTLYRIMLRSFLFLLVTGNTLIRVPRFLNLLPTVRVVLTVDSELWNPLTVIITSSGSPRAPLVATGPPHPKTARTYLRWKLGVEMS